MKKYVFIVLLSFSSMTVIGQSVTIVPNSISNETNSTINNIQIRGNQQPRITGIRSSGSYTSPSAVGSGNYLLRLGGEGYNGTLYTEERAEIGFWSNQTWTSSANGTRMTFSTTENGSISMQERMRIEDDGDVGIGTTNPQARLALANSSNNETYPSLKLLHSSATGFNRINFENSGRSELFMISANIASTDASSVWNVFHSNGGNQLRVFGDGRVAVGGITPETKFHVETGGITINHDNSSTDVINFKLNNPVASAGIKFNSSAGALLGGLIHQQTRTQLFRGANSDAGLTINSNNNMGWNNSNPSVPFHLNSGAVSTNSSTGAMILGVLTSNHLTFDNNEINSYNNTTGAELRLNEESNGDVVVAGSSDLRVQGFTKLGGTSAPNIKMKKFSGTTDSDNNTSVTHGLTASKIISVNAAIQTLNTYYAPGNGFINTTFHYELVWDSTTIQLDNVGTSLQNDPYVITVIYEE